MKKIYYVLSPIPLIIFILLATRNLNLGGGDLIGNGILFVLQVLLFDVLLSIVGIILIIVAKKKGQPLKPLVISTAITVLPILYFLYHL
jgi:hypothetical protein